MDNTKSPAPMKPLHVALHVHSTWSYDGHWSLAAIARLYGALGVQAVMMTEHDSGFAPANFRAYREACAAASTKRCTLIPGIEYSSPDNDIHVLTWGLNRFLAEHRPITETLMAVRAAGGVAILAHPSRRGAWCAYDPAWTPLLSGVELWNRKADGVSWGVEALKLIHQTGLPATVGQDFHGLRQLYPLTQVFHTVTRPYSPATLETSLVEAIALGQSAAHAFCRPVLGPTGFPTQSAYPRLERLRRHTRDLMRRSRPRS
jgi:hypothetical protein